MRRNLSRVRWLALLAGVLGPSARADSPQPLPTPFPQARYRQMTARSPFAVATADSAPPASAAIPGFASQLYVDGVAHVGNTDFVAIKSRDPDPNKPAVLLLEVGESSQDGMKIERVQWSNVMGKSTVDVSKAGEKATLMFDEAQMAKVPGGNSSELIPVSHPGRSGWPGFANANNPQQVPVFVPGASDRPDVPAQSGGGTPLYR